MRRADGATRSDQDPLDKALVEVLRVAEGEWCDMAGFVDDDGLPEKTASGRGRGPVFKRLPVVPRMPDQGMGRTDEIGLGFNLIINCWNEMIGIISRTRSTGVVTKAAKDRWDAFIAQMRKQTGLIAKVVQSDPMRWRWKCLGAAMRGGARLHVG